MRGLRADGFSGFVRFQEIDGEVVPREPGVYVVLRVATATPMFLEVSPAGHFKGRDPTVPVSDLRAAWVPGAKVVYIGKAAAGRSGRGLRKAFDRVPTSWRGEAGGALGWTLHLAALRSRRACGGLEARLG